MKYDNIIAIDPLLPTVPCNVVYHEDCMEGLKRFPDNYFDLAVVDPPYGIGEHGQRPNRTDRWKSAPKEVKYKKVEWDTCSPEKTYFIELMRVSKNQIVWGANHFISKIPYDSPCWLVWDKKATGNFADCELAWTSFKTSVRKFEWLWNGFRKEKPEERIHPTQKPVALYDWIFANYASDGNLILDTHLGSGSSRIAAHKAGLSFVGFEIDKDYFEAQEKRFKTFTSQLRLF